MLYASILVWLLGLIGVDKIILQFITQELLLRKTNHTKYFWFSVCIFRLILYFLLGSGGDVYHLGIGNRIIRFKIIIDLLL